MFGSMGITELVLILFIVLIIFGAGKLPQLGEGLGKAIKGFKKSVHEADAIELEAQQAQGQISNDHLRTGGLGERYVRQQDRESAVHLSHLRKSSRSRHKPIGNCLSSVRQVSSELSNGEVKSPDLQARCQ